MAKASKLLSAIMIKRTQDFINVVSVFNSRCGVAFALQEFHNKESSEIAVVQALLATLKLQSVVFTFDSLHCQKKPYS